jgi:hypothetical protein
MTDRPQGPDPLEPYRHRRVGPVDLLLGDAREVLSAMPDASVDVIVTSPPFWSLRDYGTGRWADGNPECPHPAAPAQRVDGAVCAACGAVWADPQYGLEPTVEQYVQHPIDVFGRPGWAGPAARAPTTASTTSPGLRWEAPTRTDRSPPRTRGQRVNPPGVPTSPLVLAHRADPTE